MSIGHGRIERQILKILAPIEATKYTAAKITKRMAEYPERPTKRRTGTGLSPSQRKAASVRASVRRALAALQSCSQRLPTFFERRCQGLRFSGSVRWGGRPP